MLLLLLGLVLDSDPKCDDRRWVSSVVSGHKSRGLPRCNSSLQRMRCRWLRSRTESKLGFSWGIRVIEQLLKENSTFDLGLRWIYNVCTFWGCG